MKKILMFFIACMPDIVCAATTGTYKVCGVNTIGHEYAYSIVTVQENMYLGSWAVGDGCDNNDAATTNMDVATMCSTVVAGGHAYCSTSGWLNSDLDETVSNGGEYCWCRRTKMLVGDQLLDSVGQWVMLGSAGTECFQKCAKYCAENVTNNYGGMHHAIMILPAF